MSKLRRLSKRSKVLIGALLSLVLIFFVASAARAALTDPNSQYRYFEATNGDVREVVSTSGSIDSSSRSEAIAGVGGTVESIRVQTGDTVSANQILVVLDRSEAKSSYLKAQAEYDQAVADLDSVESGQSSTVSSSQSVTSDSGSSSTSGSGTGTSTRSLTKAETSKGKTSSGGQSDGQSGGQNAGESAILKRLKESQKQVTVAQSAVTHSMAAANEALKHQVVICGATTSNDDSGEDAPSSSQVSGECQEALTAVQAAQETVSKDQTKLQNAINSLIDLLVKAAKETESAAKELAKQAGGSGNSSGSGGSGAPTSSDQIQSNATSSAASLAQAQAKVDSAKASLIEAEENLDATVIRSPRAGKIAGVSVAEDAQVSAGDSVAVVVGNGGAVVSMSLTATTVKQVKAGQSAEVTVIGSTNPLKGKVSWVSPVSSATSSFPGVTSNASYAATMEVPKSEISSKAFPQGVRVNIEIEIGSAQDTLVVPVSALSSRTDPTVQILDDGQTSRANVEIGLVGKDLAQVTGGLEAGQSVVIADLDAEIDAAGEVTTTNSGPGGRGMPSFGGGGFPGGGFPGGSGRGGR